MNNKELEKKVAEFTKFIDGCLTWCDATDIITDFDFDKCKRGITERIKLFSLDAERPKAEDVAELQKEVGNVIKAISTLPEDIFGHVDDTHDAPGWYIRDELLYRLRAALKKIGGFNEEV